MRLLCAWRCTGALVLLMCCAHLAALAADAVSEQVMVSGDIKSALTLKVVDLQRFPADQITSIATTRRAGDREIASVLRGVKLTALIERAGLLGTNHNEWKHTVVTAAATDGYQVVFSWPELINTAVGSGVIVVFERDGQPLADREGQIALFSAQDLNAGPRSVKWLARLNVTVLKE